jgi:hypothetical protein
VAPPQKPRQRVHEGHRLAREPEVVHDHAVDEVAVGKLDDGVQPDLHGAQGVGVGRDAVEAGPEPGDGFSHVARRDDDLDTALGLVKRR